MDHSGVEWYRDINPVLVHKSSPAFIPNESSTNETGAAQPQPKKLPLLHRMEERAGERRELCEDAPLLDPLPTPASRGEEVIARRD
jgi:hypothetical protein